MTDNKEYRTITSPLNVDIESRKVEGYAAVFNSPSEGLDWIETLSAGSMDEETIARSDVFARTDHDPDRILARSNKGKGSLALTIDERGLRYSFDAPNTQAGNDLLEYLRRGDITGSSFCFSIATDGDKWEQRNGTMYRTINKIDRLFDVAPVFQPAYPETSCSTKRYAEVKATCDEVNRMLDTLKDEINNL